MDGNRIFRELVAKCEREIDMVTNRNFLLDEKICAHMKICIKQQHIHIDFFTRSLKFSYTIGNEDDRERMHTENFELVNELMADIEIISTTVQKELETE